jgi:hypothetical protein
VVSFTLLPLYPRGKNIGTNWKGDCVGPRAGLNNKEKSRIFLCRDSNNDPNHIVPQINYEEVVLQHIIADVVSMGCTVNPRIMRRKMFLERVAEGECAL